MSIFKTLRHSLIVMVMSSISMLSHAGLMGNYDAMISAGNESGTTPRQDVLDALRDPNVLDSPFTGVVSIATIMGDNEYICSGTLISDTHILTAGHCVDESGGGDVINLANNENDVIAVFNHDGDAAAVIRAKNVEIHHDYQGFQVCADGSLNCVNDDLAIIELTSAAPAEVTRHPIYNSRVNNSAVDGIGDIFTMVGYGRHGDGYQGYYDQYDLGFSPSYVEKYVGGNIVDFVDGDDEGGLAAEVFYTDFDGWDSENEVAKDPFCSNFGVCSYWLEEGFEAGLGGGDSGGASFIWDGITQSYLLAAVNTFTIDFENTVAGGFGLISGGILLESYTDWIYETIDIAVPEPGSMALFGIGLFAVYASRKQKVRVAH